MNTSVDSSDEHPRTGRRNLLKVCSSSLALFGPERSLQCSSVAEVQLGDPMVGLFATVGRSDETSTLPALQARDLLDQRAMHPQVVGVETGNVIGLGIQDNEFYGHGRHPSRRHRHPLLSGRL